MNTINNKNDYKQEHVRGGREGVGEFVIVWYWGFGIESLKRIIHLQSFCIELVGWVFIKTGKGKKETFFYVPCLGCFEIIIYIGYETLSNPPIEQKLCSKLGTLAVPLKKTN